MIEITLIFVIKQSSFAFSMDLYDLQNATPKTPAIAQVPAGSVPLGGGRCLRRREELRLAGRGSRVW